MLEVNSKFTTVDDPDVNKNWKTRNLDTSNETLAALPPEGLLAFVKSVAVSYNSKQLYSVDGTTLCAMAHMNIMTTAPSKECPRLLSDLKETSKIWKHLLEKTDCRSGNTEYSKTIAFTLPLFPFTLGSSAALQRKNSFFSNRFVLFPRDKLRFTITFHSSSDSDSFFLRRSMKVSDYFSADAMTEAKWGRALKLKIENLQLNARHIAVKDLSTYHMPPATLHFSVLSSIAMNLSGTHSSQKIDMEVPHSAGFVFFVFVRTTTDHRVSSTGQAGNYFLAWPSNLKALEISGNGMGSSIIDIDGLRERTINGKKIQYIANLKKSKLLGDWPTLDEMFPTSITDNTCSAIIGLDMHLVHPRPDELCIKLTYENNLGVDNLKLLAVFESDCRVTRVNKMHVIIE